MVGYTADECNAALRALHPGTSSIACRFSDLKRRRLIEQARNPDSSPMERLTRSQRWAAVWVPTKTGRSVVAANQSTFDDLGDITKNYHRGDPHSERAHRSIKNTVGLQMFRTLQAICKATPEGWVNPPKRPRKPAAQPDLFA